MRKTTMCLTAIAMVAAQLHGQAQTLSFEVASVRPSESLPPPGSSGAVIRPDQFDAPSYPLQALVALAHGISNARITGWPEWTQRVRYDVRAKTARPSTRQEVLAMLQTLLAERFSLKVHRETREMDIYALVVARPGATGPKLQPVAVDCETKKLLDGSGPGLFPPDARPACGTSVNTVRMAAGPSLTISRRAAWTMEQMALGLGGGVGRPVIDRTGLTGTFDAELTYVAENPASPSFPVPSSPQPPPDGVSLRDAIRQQLGLDLRSERGPVEFLVIDAIERPTAN
jgi:uncharacterized protein (TIGR03435 family)